MPDKILNLVFKATDQASDVIDELTGASGETGVGAMVETFRNFIGPATLVAGAITGVGASVIALMENWQDHVLGVADMAAQLGITAEEASVLTSISDTYNISAGTMLSVMENLAKNGLPPTIEGLIAAKDQIEQSIDPTERLMAAQELLGSQGVAALLPLFDELTNEQLAEYITGMSESEIVTGEMIEAARENRIAIDNLGKAFDGVKLKLGGWVAPGLTALIETLSRPFSHKSAAAFIIKFWGLNAPDPYDVMPSVSGGRGAIVPAAADYSNYAIDQDAYTNQHGGSFRVGGWGGSDSQLVKMAVTPGETISVSNSGGGGGDPSLVAKIRRLVDTLPTIMRDAVERSI